MSNRYLAQKLLQKRFQAKNTPVIIFRSSYLILFQEFSPNSLRIRNIFFIISGRIHLKNKVECRPEKECHWVDRNEIIFWYSKQYFVPKVTKIRFQIKPHIFFLFFYDGIQRNFNSKSAVSRFLGISEIEN